MPLSGMEDELGPKKGKGLQFDATISLGHVLTIATMVCALVVAYATYRESFRDHENRITMLERQYVVFTDQMKTIGSIREDVAVIKDRTERIPAAAVPSR